MKGIVAGAARRAVRSRFRPALTSDVGSLARRYTVEPDWERKDDGYAVRLDTRTTIDVRDRVGRWRNVDPRRPQDAWRAPWKAVGLVAWGSAVGTAWWLGSSRGRGPLAMLHRDDASEPGPLALFHRDEPG